MKRLYRIGMMALALVLTLSMMTVPAFASGELVAETDSASSYTPTQIVNGGFEASTCGVYPARLGTDEGWNTTDSIFERSTDCSVYGIQSPTGGSHFIELEATNPSANVYQDLTTYGGDIIRWTLDHASRKTFGSNPQSMKVQIGAPDGNKPIIGNIHIDSSTLVTYASTASTGITNPQGATYGYGNDAELANLAVPQLSSNNPWYTAKGVYVVPEDQSVTRLALVSCNNSGGGNMVDNVTFSTLVGNLSATANTDGSVTVKGYWGDTDTSKNLYIKIGSTVIEVDMGNVCGKNFKVNIPAEKVSGATQVEVYHEDYPSAKRTVTINHGHDWTDGNSEDGSVLYVWCKNANISSQCAYQGKANALTMTITASDKVYDGQPAAVTVTYSDGWSSLFSEADMLYARTADAPEETPEELLTAAEYEWTSVAPTATGQYIVAAAIGELSAYTTFTIYRDDSQTVAPTSVTGTPESKKGAKDGKLSGLDDTMQVSTDGGETWEDVPAGVTEATGLSGGKYMVRYKATDTAMASPAVTIDLTAPVPTGDSTPVVMLMTLMLMSAVAMVIMNKRKKA